jgi:hypothetical protein
MISERGDNFLKRCHLLLIAEKMTSSNFSKVFKLWKNLAYLTDIKSSNSKIFFELILYSKYLLSSSALTR